MQPRKWLAVSALATALWGSAAAGGHPPLEQQSGTRPNILLIMGDDHAAYALGCYGSTIARTPNLDRLAAEGARFERAYCNSPVCTPSRQSLITGLMPHAAGVTQLTTPLAEEALTLADHLSAQGYDTATIGKMHFNSRRKHGFQLTLNEPEWNEQLRRQPPQAPPAGVKTAGVFRPFRDPAAIWLNSENLPYQRQEDMDAHWFAGRAEEYLRAPRKRPFFLITSFTQPHSPFRFPLGGDQIRPEGLPVPRVGPEDAWQVPKIFRDLTDDQKRGINAAYYNSVAYLDQSVGRVLQALEASGHARNTLVVYLGDHGYNLGHHGRFEKHCFWETAVRTPLLVRWPQRVRPGRVVRDLTEFVDLFPTFCEATGSPTPEGLHGRSLVPVLTGRGGTGRREVLSVYAENEEAMLRDERWKLIYCTGKRARQDGYDVDTPTPGRYAKLYDLREDPDEMRNLAEDPRHAGRRRRMLERLVQRLRETHPPAVLPPAQLSPEEQLDRLLVPVELQRTAQPGTNAPG